MFTIKPVQKIVSLLLVPLVCVSCGLNPQAADIGLDETLPEAKITVYQNAIDRLGLMTDIYGNSPLKIMTKEILDDTGTSVATNAEIPRDITEMVKSTLNGIGGNVLYIPYEPLFMQNTAGTGYSDYGDKILPQVILSGGITEFDRALVTKGDALEADIEIAKEYGINFSDEEKASLASVTLDFNLIDFKTFTGIPRIQAVNGIKLHKATREDSIGFTVKSATLGARGEIKKVQGRHAAVRMLVQLSIMQIIGRYEKLPYWRLVPGAGRDNIVVDQVLADYSALTLPEKIAKTQELLYMHGFINVVPNGQIDDSTKAALRNFANKQGIQAKSLTPTLYLALYENLPVDFTTLERKKTLSLILVNNAQAAVVAAPAPQPQQTAQPAPVTAPQKSTGTLTLATEKAAYNIGESLKINFSVSEPMYVRIVVINSKGSIDTLFPNAYQSDNFCQPGKNYSIPSSGADFTLDIGGPAGIDKIRAIGDSKPIPANALYFTQDGQFDDSKMANYTIRAAFDYVIH